MKLNVRDALAAAAAIRTGQLAGQAQGTIQRRNQEAEDYNRALQSWQVGHSLENEALSREDAADQVLIDAANLMEADDPLRATYMGQALNNRMERTKRKRRYGQESMPVMPGMERLFPPPSAFNPGAVPSSPLQGSPAGTSAPLGPGAPAGGMVPTAPAGQGSTPQVAPLGPDGKPLPPPPQYTPEQVEFMRQTVNQVAPLIPGGRGIADLLNMPNVGDLIQRGPAPAPAPIGTAMVGDPANQPQPIGAAPVGTVPVGQPGQARNTTPTGEGMLAVGGLPAFRLGGTVSDADSKSMGKRIEAAQKFITEGGLSGLSGPARAQIEAILPTLPASFSKGKDFKKGQEFLALIQPYLPEGSLALRKVTDAENEGKVKGFKDRIKDLDNQDPHALTAELPALFDEMEGLRGDKTFRGTLPSTLKSSAADIKKIKDLTAQANDAAAAGNQAEADRLMLQAQSYAKLVAGRVRAKKSSQEEDRAMRRVQADLADASTAQRQNPQVVRAIYKRHGLDYVADKMSDDELTAGGGAVAEKAFNHMITQLDEMAKLGKWSGQGTFLQAIGQAAKEAGKTVEIPAELVLQMTPLERARLRNMNQQFRIAGNADKRAEAAAALARDKFTWQKTHDRKQWDHWKATEKGKKGGALTENEKVQAAKQMWMRSADGLSKFLSAIKNPEEDEKTMTPAERTKYRTLKQAERQRRKEYIDSVAARGGPRLSMDAGNEPLGLDIQTDGDTRKPASQMTDEELLQSMGG